MLDKTGRQTLPSTETMTEKKPIRTIDSGTVYWYEDGPTDSPHSVRNEDATIEIYDSWVRVKKIQPIWIPRESVDQIHEY